MYLISGRARAASSNTQRSRSQTGSSASAQRRDPVEPHASELGLDGLDLREPADDSLDDADLNDPGLLGELEALRAEMGLASPPQQKPKRISGNAAAAAAAQAAQPKAPEPSLFGEDDRALESVSVTEEDMNDPSLLAELSGFTNTHSTVKPAANASPKLAEQTSRAQAAESPADGTLSSTNSDGKVLAALIERHAELKAAALAAKRQGDMDHAREMLLQMKSVQSAVQTLRSGQQLPQDYAVPPKPAAAIAANVPERQERIQSAPASQSKLPEASTARSTSGQPASHVSTPVRQKPQATRPAASAAPKRAQPPSKDSNKPRAAALAAATELGKLMLADGQQKEFELIAQSFGSMKEKLEHQISQATQLAAYFLKRGEKQMALEFHRLKKRAVADLATVNSFQANNRPLPPPFLHKEIQWTAPAEQRRDISISELQVAIMRLVSDGDLAATFGGKADFYIQWELAWPRDKTNKAYTRTIKFKELEENGYELDLDYKHNVDVVDRQHPRPLQRWVERGRLAIELYKYSGIIWGSQLIGKAALPLADLRTRSEVTALVEIKTGSDPLGRSAKPLPGGPLYVEVAARLRLPLSNSAEMAGHVEHWIYIDSQPSPQPSPQPMPSQQTTPQPSADAEKPEPVQEISPPPLADSAQSSQQAGASGPVAGGSFRKLATAQPSIAADNTAVVESSNADMAEIEAQMDSMDAVVSNAVLELELMQIPSRIGQTKDRDTASQLQDLEAAIKLRMSVVAAQVGAGALTIQEYMGNVTKELEAAKGWALAAKKGQRKDLALRALKRVKAMQNELKEMAEAMESAGDA